MNNQGLLALAQLILPSEILTNFEVVRVEEEASLIRISVSYTHLYTNGHGFSFLC